MVAEGWLRRVALDVLDMSSRYLRAISWRTIPRVVVTPHVAWLTDRAVERMMRLALAHCGVVTDGSATDDVMTVAR